MRCDRRETRSWFLCGWTAGAETEIAMQREVEDLSKSLWNVVNTVVKSPAQPDLKAKREQLKVVNESVQQLSQKGVPVPEDLEKLKKTLTEEVKKADKEQVVLFFLREQLSQMLAKIEVHTGLKITHNEKEPAEDQ